jgi:hypothetical protein
MAEQHNPSLWCEALTLGPENSTGRPSIVMNHVHSLFNKLPVS